MARGAGGPRRGFYAVSWCGSTACRATPRFRTCSTRWTPVVCRRGLCGFWRTGASVVDGAVGAIDGQSLRRSCAAARSPVHLVQACAAGARLGRGQVQVDDRPPRWRRGRSGWRCWRSRAIRAACMRMGRFLWTTPPRRANGHQVSMLPTLPDALRRAAPRSATSLYGGASAMTGRGWPPSARSRRGARSQTARHPHPAPPSGARRARPRASRTPGAPMGPLITACPGDSM